MWKQAKIYSMYFATVCICFSFAVFVLLQCDQKWCTHLSIAVAIDNGHKETLKERDRQVVRAHITVGAMTIVNECRTWSCVVTFFTLCFTYDKKSKERHSVFVKALDLCKISQCICMCVCVCVCVSVYPRKKNTLQRFNHFDWKQVIKKVLI